MTQTGVIIIHLQYRPGLSESSTSILNTHPTRYNGQ